MEENRRILVIDDDEGIRETYLSIFSPNEESDVMPMDKSLFDDEKFDEAKEEAVYDISLAENGTIGIEKISLAKEAGEPIALVFVDMKMPGIDGAETSQKIWQIDPEVKIIIVTAYSEYTPKEIIKVTGRDDLFYLRKPFNHEEILQFARALTKEWNLENKRKRLEKQIREKNEQLTDVNANLNEKVKKQAGMIVQAEKMASLGLLTAGVAHEINNPVAFINSNLSLVKQYLDKINGMFEKLTAIESFLRSKNDPEAELLLAEADQYRSDSEIDMILEDFQDLADESLDGVDRIKTIVKDLKTFSRLEGDEKSDIDINDTIDYALKILTNELKYKVEIEKKYEKIPLIKCHSQKISQVFINILMNAGQAIEEKGKIEIITQSVVKGKRATDKYVAISIRDTGCGIPQENINKLFDPFFTTKPVGKGTGLGLSIVYEIVKEHGGKLDVESVEGKGTTFTICLPVRKE